VTKSENCDSCLVGDRTGWAGNIGHGDLQPSYKKFTGSRVDFDVSGGS
jgi:hypothetical protein